MPTKLKVLQQLSQGELQSIAESHDLAVADWRRLDDLIDAVRVLSKTKLVDALQGLDRDLEATLRALEQGLSFYDGQLQEMRDFAGRWNGEISGPQGDYATRAADLRRGVAMIAMSSKSALTLNWSRPSSA